MGDVGEYWRDHKEYKRKKKAEFSANAPSAKETIRAAGHTVEQLSVDHFRVNGIVDWWPTTGTWRQMHGKKTGWGVNSLLEYLKDISK